MATSSSASRKVWLGNVDPRVSEYQLLKAASAFGCIETFDFLYGVDGAGRRVPKGFAFVTYVAANSAEKAIAGLDGVRIGDRKIVAKWANSNASSGAGSRKRPHAATSSSSSASAAASSSAVSKEATIRAMEAKLLAMQSEDNSSFTLAIPSKSKDAKR